MPSNNLSVAGRGHLRPALTALVLCLLLVAAFWLRLQPYWLTGASDLAEIAARSQVAAEQANSQTKSGKPTAFAEQWITEHPDEFAKKTETIAKRIRRALTYQTSDGHSYPYLPILDSYVWLRLARNLQQTGSPCSDIVDGVCRDNQVLAPVGMASDYAWSLHIHIIAGLHHVLTWLRPGLPLPIAALLLQVLVGASVVIPAFLAGRLLAGPWCGIAAALLLSANSAWLDRSLGGDTDVWNVALPMWGLWAILAALCRPGLLRPAAFAALTAILVGLQAAIWRGWPMMFLIPVAALTLLAGLETLRIMVRRGQIAVLGKITLILTVFVAIAALATYLAGSGEHVLGALKKAAGMLLPRMDNGLPPPLEPSEKAYWPNMFTWVQELQRSGHQAMISEIGAVLLIIALIGVCWSAIVAPRWRAIDGAILALALAAAMVIVAAPDLPTIWLLALVTIPVAIAIVSTDPIDATTRPLGDRAGSVLLTIGLLAPLYLSQDGDRFIMLTAPAVSLAAGLVVARSIEGIKHFAAGPGRLPKPTMATLGLIIAVALMAVPLREGHQSARQFLPKFNDAWAGIFETARQAKPAEGSITTWWDYGTWAAYFSGRPAATDGTTLGRYVHHWLGRAWAEPRERRAAGLLRMLACGSDPSPTPGDRSQGAYGRLVDAGLHPLVAHRVTDTIVGMGARQARGYLNDIQIPSWLQDALLQRSHCRPPSGLLVLNSELVRKLTWLQNGLWDHRIAYVSAMSDIPEADLDLASIGGVTGLSHERIKQIHRDARAKPANQRWKMAAIKPEFSSDRRYPCRRIDSEIECRMTPGQAANARRNVAFRFPAAAPEKGKFLFLNDGGDVMARIAPAVIVTSQRQGMKMSRTKPPHQAKAAVLIDLFRMQAIYGPPQLMTSLYAQLMFLNGRHNRYFKKLDDRVSYLGERITLWQVSYPTD